MKPEHVLKYFLFLLIVLSFSKAFTQPKDLVYYENKMIGYHIEVDTRLANGRDLPYDSPKRDYMDSVEYFITLLDTSFERLIRNNPKTLDFPFKRMVDSSLCKITTAADGNFRVYNLDAWQLSTEIYQWRSNGKTYTKVFRYPKDSSGLCGAIATVTINGRHHYLPVTACVIWPKHSMQSVTAWRIKGNQLEAVKLFKNQAGTTDRIDVPMSFANFFDKKRDSLPYIKYDDKEKKLYIPFVNGMEVVTNKYFIYDLKGAHLEFTSIGEMKKERGIAMPRK